VSCPVDPKNKKVVDEGVGGDDVEPSLLRGIGRRGRSEDDFGPAEGQGPRSFGEEIIPAELNADLPAGCVHHKEPGLAGLKIIFFIPAGDRGDMGFLINPDGSPVRIKDRGRAEGFFPLPFKEGTDQHDLMVTRRLTKRVKNFVIKGNGMIECLWGFLFQKPGEEEDLRKTDDPGPTLGGMADITDGLPDVSINIIGTENLYAGDLDGGSPCNRLTYLRRSARSD